jgi:hypothetical protein
MAKNGRVTIINGTDITVNVAGEAHVVITTPDGGEQTNQLMDGFEVVGTGSSADEKVCVAVQKSTTSGGGQDGKVDDEVKPKLKADPPENFYAGLCQSAETGDQSQSWKSSKYDLQRMNDWRGENEPEDTEAPTEEIKGTKTSQLTGSSADEKVCVAVQKSTTRGGGQDGKVDDEVKPKLKADPPENFYILSQPSKPGKAKRHWFLCCAHLRGKSYKILLPDEVGKFKACVDCESRKGVRDYTVD